MDLGAKGPSLFVNMKPIPTPTMRNTITAIPFIPRVELSRLLSHPPCDGCQWRPQGAANGGGPFRASNFGPRGLHTLQAPLPDPSPLLSAVLQLPCLPR